MKVGFWGNNWVPNYVMRRPQFIATFIKIAKALPVVKAHKLGMAENRNRNFDS